MTLAAATPVAVVVSDAVQWLGHAEDPSPPSTAPMAPPSTNTRRPSFQPELEQLT